MKKALYTIFFMVAITIFFITILAITNELSSKKIEDNYKIQVMKSILYAFNLYPVGLSDDKIDADIVSQDISWDKDELFKVYNEKIREVELANKKIFVYIENGKAAGYGFYISGKGLWGEIQAFCAVDFQLSHLLGLDFLKQSETPGLGARITEHWFKRYFRNLDISNFSEKKIEMVRKKEKLNTEVSANTFEAVTGATLTSRGVLNMLNNELKDYLKLIKENKGKISKELSL